LNPHLDFSFPYFVCPYQQFLAKEKEEALLAVLERRTWLLNWCNVTSHTAPEAHHNSFLNSHLYLNSFCSAQAPRPSYSLWQCLNHAEGSSEAAMAKASSASSAI
jgi:hypothetical protein